MLLTNERRQSLRHERQARVCLTPEFSAAEICITRWGERNAVITMRFVTDFTYFPLKKTDIMKAHKYWEIPIECTPASILENTTI
ncbi:hypothetical protein NQU17_07105 [Clostridiaceae bacterium HFYG-1003]|nr:hypothetical protein NQU17_07105 [Clostridiaceae bacterium HFYG-1003]